MLAGEEISNLDAISLSNCPTLSDEFVTNFSGALFYYMLLFVL